MTKVAKERDKLTLSFASEDLKKPMNELLNNWEERGYRLSTKGVTALIEMNHISNSDHFSLVSNTYHYIYKTLKKVYGDNQEALYEAVNQVLTKVVTIDTRPLMAEIARKVEEAGAMGRDTVDKLPKELTQPTTPAMTVVEEEVITPSEEVGAKELGAPILDTKALINSKREMDDQLEAQKRELAEKHQREMQEMQAQLQAQMQAQLQAQMAQFAQMQAQFMNPTLTQVSMTPAEDIQEEALEMNQEQMSNSFGNLMGQRAF